MTHEYHDKLILGGGVTGLAAGIASGATVLEAGDRPGGICSSYYVRRNVPGRLDSPGEDGDAYRFEHGGGHWIFGGHSDVVAIVQALAPCDSIERVSSVFFPGEKRYVGFPLQHHLHQLAPEIAARAVDEVMSATARREASTMAQWLEEQFGPTLADLFFHPFHEAYTAGLWREIAPQDGYKTPLDLQQVLRGAQGDAKPAGYNVRFLYPRDGLDALSGADKNQLIADPAALSALHWAVWTSPARHPAWAELTSQAPARVRSAMAESAIMQDARVGEIADVASNAAGG